jgi:hypothetical protein
MKTGLYALQINIEYKPILQTTCFTQMLDKLPTLLGARNSTYVLYTISHEETCYMQFVYK